MSCSCDCSTCAKCGNWTPEVIAIMSKIESQVGLIMSTVDKNDKTAFDWIAGDDIREQWGFPPHYEIFDNVEEHIEIFRNKISDSIMNEVESKMNRDSGSMLCAMQDFVDAKCEYVKYVEDVIEKMTKECVDIEMHKRVKKSKILIKKISKLSKKTEKADDKKCDVKSDVKSDVKCDVKCDKKCV